MFFNVLVFSLIKGYFCHVLAILLQMSLFRILDEIVLHLINRVLIRTVVNSLYTFTKLAIRHQESCERADAHQVKSNFHWHCSHKINYALEHSTSKHNKKIMKVSYYGIPVNLQDSKNERRFNIEYN